MAARRSDGDRASAGQASEGATLRRPRRPVILLDL
jgi:hypothetical protein